VDLQVGKKIKVTGSRIAGVVSCVPPGELNNEYFYSEFGQQEVEDVIKMIGVKTRRRAEESVSTSDLCLQAGLKLLKELDWPAETIDAIIFISQTPDFRLPATALVLQKQLQISSNCIAFDINLGCSGYPYALWLGMTMIQSGAADRVLLAVGDTISKLSDPHDRATAMLFGDAGTVTAIERSDGSDCAHFILGSDGNGVNNLIVSKGAFKDLSKSSDARIIKKNPYCLYMDGGEIFNFTLKCVTPLVKKTFEFSNIPFEECEYFLFHQANLFMLKHLAKKNKIPVEKFPINIDKFGNTSSASIPLLLTSNLRDIVNKSPIQLALFGFGVGYSWASASFKTNGLRVLELVEYEDI
jgi:3-oxoacyl-[acyl-carrier-protein] synthase-3